MNRKSLPLLFLYSLFLILYSTALFAAPPTTRPSAKPTSSQPAQKTKAFIWKISSPTNHVYLLGSIHMATPDMYPLSPDIEAAFKSCPTLVVELDITKVDQLSMLALVMQTGMYTDGDTLDQHIPADTMTAINTFAESTSTPAETFSNMKPWLAAVTLTELALQKAGFSTDIGIDKHFLDNAGAKKIIQLETVDSQLKVLSGFSDDLQKEWLQLTIKHLPDLKADILEMVKIWKAGDLPAMQKFLEKDYAESKNSKTFDDAFLSNRNTPMTAQIDTLLKSKSPAFIVIGAAHLVGDQGVLKLLQKKNYKIEQLQLTPAK